MKIACFVVVAMITALIVGAPAALAAPCESVESACASTAYQKVDAMLSQKIVADRLEALGVSEAQARARVSQLDEHQLQQLAAQADMIQAGGTMQSGDVNKWQPLNYLWKQFCVFWSNLYHVVFTWEASTKPY
jgi:hypothetical protein